MGRDMGANLVWLALRAAKIMRHDHCRVGCGESNMAYLVRDGEPEMSISDLLAESGVWELISWLLELVFMFSVT